MIPADLRGRLEVALVQRVIALLHSARRAGRAVEGIARVREWLARGEVGLLLQAEDCGDTGLRGPRDEASGAAGALGTPVSLRLPASVLGAVFRSGNATHVALRAGGLAEVVQREVVRLTRLSLHAETGKLPTVERRRGGRVHDGKQ